MKKVLIFLIAIACLAGQVHALTYDQANYDKHISVALQRGQNDPIRNFIGEMESVAAGGEKGTGSLFYVDSNVSSAGAGTSWTAAVATLKEGIALCSANVGDIIYVAQGHAEDITAASALDANIAGITIYCFGEGEDQPTLSLITNAGAELTISAADVTIYNLRILGAYSGGVTAGIAVTADGDGARLIGCEFWETSNTMEQLIMVSVATDADNLVIAGNRFIGTDSADPSSAIYFAGGSDKTIIQDNHFIGTWSASVVDVLQAASTGLMILDNEIVNLDATAGKTIQANASSGGSMAGNRCYANGAGFALVGDAMFIAPDNIAMATEAVPTRNYETMFGPYRGDAAGTASDSIHGDFVLAQTDLDDILVDTGTDIPASFVTTDALVNGIAASIAALSDTGWVGQHNGASSTTIAIVTLLSGFGDDYFNTEWSLIVLHNVNSDGASPEGEIRDITDYASDTGTFTLNYALGANIETGDQVMVRRTEELELDIPTVLGSAGTIRYVDSGTSGDGSGLTMENAYATVTLADAACSAGDVVYIADGHDEEVTTGTLVLDGAANTSFIGLGEGDARPLITITDDGTLMTIDNAGITVKNIRLQSGITACDIAVRIEDAGIGCTLDNIAFIDGEASTVDEFVDVISVDQSASNLTVKNCTYYSLDATGHTASFIDLSETTIDSPTIENCTIFGMFSDAAIWGNAATPVNVSIKNNTVSNTTTGVAAIAFTGAATGVCEGNKLYSDTYGANAITIIDPGSMKCIENYGTDAINETAILVPFSAETSDITATADGSELERLEHLQDMTDDMMAVLGMDQAVDNTYYVDSVGANGGTGLTWETSENTLVLAIGDATTATGATIFLAANHVENMTTVAVNKAGLKIIGLGVGEARPKLTFQDAADVLAHTVPNVMYKNIIFIAGTEDITSAVTLDASSDGAIFEDCEFRNTTTIEFADTVALTGLCDNVRFTRCKFLNLTAVGGSISAINSTNGVCDSVIIEDCDFYGTWTTAAIESSQIETNWIVRNNTVYNYSTGDYGISFSTTALGTMENNFVYSDTYATQILSGSMQMFENYTTMAIDEPGTLFPAPSRTLTSETGTGRVIYVDSGATEGAGNTWATAWNTINAAMDSTSASRGDTIYVAPGHAETVTGATGMVMDVIGVKLVGLGTGALRPTITFTTAIGATISVTGADCTIENMILLSNFATGITAAITASATGDGLTVDNVEFRDSGNTTEMFAHISLAAACDDVTIKNCYFSNTAASAETLSAVLFVAAVDNARITNNRFHLDAETACILGSAGAGTNVYIADNTFFNIDTGGLALSLNAGTTGIVVRNLAFGNVEDTSPFTAAGCMVAENYGSGGEGESGIIYPAVDN